MAMKNSKKQLYVLFILIGCCCLLAGGGFLLYHLLADRQSEETLDALRADAENYRQAQASPEPPEDLSDVSAGEETSPAPAETSAPQPSATPQPTQEPLENPYQNSFLANADMAAWLVVPNTVIDYPVMWTPGDENYYLYRDFDGRESQSGCLILDTDSCVDPITTNLIIHGHNMKSGAMFGDLDKYKDESYYQEHKEILLYTEDALYTYEVIAVFRSQVYKKTDQVFKFYQFFQADTQEEFDSFYNNIQALSLYDTGITAQFGDHFLTLSTCAYHVENGRFVVVARECGCDAVYAPFR